MKKGVFLILLAFVVGGCASSMIVNIPSQYALNAKTHNSIVLGKIVFEGIEPGFGQVLFTLQDTATEKDYPIKIAQGKERAGAIDYYFFVELPAAHYDVREILAVHKKYETIESYLLHANVTVPKSSIIHIGTIKVKGIKHAMSSLSPITEDEIVDEHDKVIKVFKDKYPQFKDAKVQTKLIDQYELFKQDGIGGKF